MNKKIAIFSDIHGNYQALYEILKDIKKQKIDNIYCLGDVIGIGPNPKECLDLIMKNNVNMVLGNHELYYLKGTNIEPTMDDEEKQHHKWISEQLNDQHKEFLKECPVKLNEQINKYNISFQHFLLNNDEYPFDDLEIIKNGTIESKINNIDSDIIFIGHEHKPFEININKKRLIDVGSSGCTKDEKTHYIILSIKDDRINIKRKNVIYNRKEFEQNFNNTLFPDKELIGKIFFGIIKQNKE